MARLRLICAAITLALVVSSGYAQATGAIKDYTDSEKAQLDLAAADSSQKKQSFITVDLDRFAHWLQKCPYQDLIAIVALLAGLFSVIDSTTFFQGIGILIFAITAGALAQSEALVYWGKDLNVWVQQLVFWEVAAITVYAAMASPKGFQCVYGFFVGIVLAYLHAGWAMVQAWDASKGALWYAASGALGAAALVIGEKTAMAVLGPILGGLLVASASNFFIANFGMTSGKDTEPWLSCVNDLLISPTNTYDFGEGANATARTVGLCLWAVVAFVGITRWFCGWPYMDYFDDEEQGVFKKLRNPLLSGDDDRRQDY